MDSARLAERRPVGFSLLILLVFFVVGGGGVAAARSMGRPPTDFVLYSESGLALIVAVIVSKMCWWREIGFRRPARLTHVVLFCPAFVPVVGNLTFGIHVTDASLLVTAAALAAMSGFVEEAAFRGLMVRAFLPRGAWTATLVTTAFFGLAHAGNVVAGFNAIYVIVQVTYALAMGFGFGAMAVKGGLVWPLVIAHALGNFVAFINGDTGQLVGGGVVNARVLIVSLVYIVIFTVYGLFLMTRKDLSQFARSTANAGAGTGSANA